MRAEWEGKCGMWSGESLCPSFLACAVGCVEDFCCVQRKSIFWCKTRNSAAGGLGLCLGRRGKTKRGAAKLWRIAASVAVLVAKLRSVGHEDAVGAELERRAWLRLVGEDRLSMSGSSRESRVESQEPILLLLISVSRLLTLPTIVGGPISTEKFGHGSDFQARASAVISVSRARFLGWWAEDALVCRAWFGAKPQAMLVDVLGCCTYSTSA